MKKFVLVVLILAVLGISAPIASAQQGVGVRHYTQSRRRRGHRTFWRKHRDKLTVAGAAAGGAGIGAIAGGKKGAAIGALSGGAGGAIYTYGIRKRHHRHRRQ